MHIKTFCAFKSNGDKEMGMKLIVRCVTFNFYFTNNQFEKYLKQFLIIILK